MDIFGKYSDKELIDLLKEPSPTTDQAFNIVYRKYSSQLFGYCVYKSASNEEAEELLQDTWLRFYNAVRNGKHLNNILPFLFSIARNISIDKYRSRNAKKQIEINYLDTNILEQFSDPFNMQDEFDREELSNLIRLGINYLDEIYKDAIALYWFGNLTYTEIAEICNETEACIRTRLARAFKQLAGILKPYLIDN